MNSLNRYYNEKFIKKRNYRLLINRLIISR